MAVREGGGILYDSSNTIIVDRQVKNHPRIARQLLKMQQGNKQLETLH